MTTVAELLVQTLNEIGVRQVFGLVGDALNPLQVRRDRGCGAGFSRDQEPRHPSRPCRRRRIARAVAHRLGDGGQIRLANFKELFTPEPSAT